MIEENTEMQMSTLSRNSSMNLTNFPSDAFLSTLIASFPTEWQGFFGALNVSASNSVQNACLWLAQKLSSNNGNFEGIPPNFTVLFEHLTREFPVVFEDNLSFKPKILLLPLHIQRNLYSFILSKSASIPLESLQLLDTKLDIYKESYEGWSSTLGKLLKLKIKELERKKERSKLEQGGKATVYVDIITDQSRERFMGVCQKINEATPFNKMGISSTKQWKSLELKESEKVFSSKMIPPFETCSDASTGLEREFTSMKNDAVVNIMDIDVREENSQKGLLDQNIMANQLDLSHSPTKKVRLEEGPQADERKNLQFIPPAPVSLDVVDHDETVTISRTLQLKITPLHDLIQESSESVKATSCVAALKVFCELSSFEIEKVFDVIKLDNLSEQTFASLCQNFVSLESEPSYMHASAFASLCILPRVQKLEQVASRLLTAAMMSFSKKYPKAVCDGLFIKLLTHSSFNSFQADLLSKTLKDMPNRDTSRTLLQLLLKSDNCLWNDNMILVVQTIIDFKLVLDENFFKDYMNILQENSDAMAKSLKFAKLLLATINNYSTQIVLHKELIENILQRNQTFLKKAGHAALKKVLANIQI